MYFVLGTSLSDYILSCHASLVFSEKSARVHYVWHECIAVQYGLARVHCVSDIDECAAGVDNCEQQCNNAVPGFTCACNVGYKLSSDERTCIGELDHEDIVFDERIMFTATINEKVFASSSILR